MHGLTGNPGWWVQSPAGLMFVVVESSPTLPLLFQAKLLVQNRNCTGKE